MSRRQMNTGMGSLGRTAYMRTVNINTLRGLGENDYYAQEYLSPDAPVFNGYDPWSNSDFLYAQNPVPVQTLPSGQTIYSPQGNGAVIQSAGSAGPGTSSYGTGTIMDSIKQALQLAPAIVGVKNMDALQKMNMERLQRGQPLLTAQQMAQMTTPVNFGLSPQVSQMLLIAGIALIAVMAMKKR